MQETFNTLINSYIENKIGIANDFLSDSIALNLKKNLITLYKEKSLLSAGVGNTANLGHDKLFRSDIISWLDRKHNNLHENNFFDLVDNFVRHLNDTCYTGITSYEFHYTLYEKGSFYKRHLDQFRNDDSRKYSMVMYLNNDWEIDDGGELCIYHDGKSQSISPLNGRTVFFKSNELEHEVLLTNKPRMSITGWLKA